MANDRDDPDRDAILARRRRFLALALSGMAVAGCESSPAPCLRVAGDASQEVPDAGPEDAGVSADASPMPCLAPEP